jgi:hypothetical protein
MLSIDVLGTGETIEKEKNKPFLDKSEKRKGKTKSFLKTTYIYKHTNNIVS